MPLKLTGVNGQVKWSYHVAADVQGYTITRQAQEWRLRATVVKSNDYALQQFPLVFVAPHEKGEWLFPILQHEVKDGVLTAQIGAPLETANGSQKSVRETGDRSNLAVER